MSRVVNKTIYLDNAASTPIDPGVLKEMSRLNKIYGNPSSFNNAGRTARKEIEKARIYLARFTGTRGEGVVFTSSGSEANNLAIFGFTGMFQKPGEVISTPIEHPSVREPLKKLEKMGWKISYLRVDRQGFVDLNDLRDKLNPRVRLVSVIYANNEIGTIQPIKKIAKIILDFRNRESEIRNRKLGIDEKRFPLVHLDACQAAGFLDMNINNLGADMITFNGTKIYGPKGIGVLAMKKGIKLRSLILGGEQESGLRAGTENSATIAGLAAAVSLINKYEISGLLRLREYFISELIKIVPDIRLNGPVGEGRLPNNINISFAGVESDNLLIELDKYGIYASSGSACTARSVEPSHVLKAIGVEGRYLSGALRISLGRQTTKKDINRVLKVFPKIVSDLRNRYKK